jgi:hypothetical protein
MPSFTFGVLISSVMFGPRFEWPRGGYCCP